MFFINAEEFFKWYLRTSVKAVTKGSAALIKYAIEASESKEEEKTENAPPPKSTAELKGMSERMKNAGKLSLNYGGCVFGKLNGANFGKSAERDGHILVVGGSGSGKSSCFAIPSILNWKNSSLFCLDIKGELYRKAGYTHANKERVKVFDPCDISGADVRYGYDPFYFLNQARNKAQEAHAIATALIPLSPSHDNPFWITSAQNLLTGSIIHYHNLGYSFSQTMKKSIDKPVDELIIDIYDNSKDENAKLYISSFIGMSEKTLSSVYAELHRHIILFATDEDVKTCLNSDKKLNPEDLQNEGTIYICIPQNLLDEWKNLLSLMITQFLRYFQKLPEMGDNRILFLIDEFARIGKLEGINNALATLRDKNITIALIIQSLAQLDEIYGEKSRQVIAENCNHKVIFNATDADTQEYFSRIIGTYDKYKKISGRQYEIITSLPTGRNISVTTEEKRIIKPEEFATLDDVVVTTPDGFFRVSKDPYYLNSAYRELIEKAQYKEPIEKQEEIIGDELFQSMSYKIIDELYQEFFGNDNQHVTQEELERMKELGELGL